MAVQGPTGGGMRRSGTPRTWRDDFDGDTGVDPGFHVDWKSGVGSRRSGSRAPVRTIPRWRSPTPNVLVPARLPGGLLRQFLYAALIVVLAAAAFRLPYGLGARLQAAAADALSRDVDLEQAALAVREAVRQGRAWLAGTLEERDGALPAGGPGTGEPAWVWPAAGTALVGYGWVENGEAGVVLHEGLDIAAEQEAPVTAAAAGTVVRVWSDAGTGGLGVEIDHGDGWSSRYLHLREAYVAAGDAVAAGDVIATVGEPGHGDRPNLHFEIRRDGSPVDPQPKLRRHEDSW